MTRTPGPSRRRARSRARPPGPGSESRSSASAGEFYKPEGTCRQLSSIREVSINCHFRLGGCGIILTTQLSREPGLPVSREIPGTGRPGHRQIAPSSRCPSHGKAKKNKDQNIIINYNCNLVHKSIQSCKKCIQRPNSLFGHSSLINRLLNVS